MHVHALCLIKVLICGLEGAPDMLTNLLEALACLSQGFCCRYLTCSHAKLHETSKQHVRVMTDISALSKGAAPCQLTAPTTMPFAHLLFVLGC